MSMEMDFSRRCLKLEKNYEQCYYKKSNIKNSVLDYIRYKPLNWYGHVQRMDQEKLPRRILNGAHLEDEGWEDFEIGGCRK